jgi:hypothetical protein
MEQSPSLEVNRSTSRQEIPRISQNPKFRYSTDKCQPLVPTPGTPKVRPCEIFLNIISFKTEEFLAPHQKSKLEYHPLSAVRYFLFDTFAATGGYFSTRHLRMRHAVVTGIAYHGNLETADFKCHSTDS